MPARRPTLLLSLAMAAATACAGASVSHSPAPCPAAAQLLSESAQAHAEGSLFRALARAEAADRACSIETTRAAVSAARSELYGPDTPPAATAEDAQITRTAAYVRLAGDPARSLSLLQPLSAQSRLDGAGLVELSRAGSFVVKNGS